MKTLDRNLKPIVVQPPRAGAGLAGGFMVMAVTASVFAEEQPFTQAGTQKFWAQVEFNF